ncbi:MAG TPA: ABC transporter substrate-binding protein [Dehalococcoidia bacterium]|nr:ABC transporter substrate-binding protein [Dehalococcoidia bacterium]
MGDNELGLRYWQRKRLSRRRVLAGAATGAAALGAISLVGCGDSGNGTTGGRTRTPSSGAINDGYQDGPGKPGGVLKTRQDTALPSMNPFGPGIFALAQQLTLGFTVFDHLWYVPTDTGELELFLATNVEQPDDLTVIATIGDATFHDKPPVDGRKVLASDVAASYKRFRAEAPIGYSWLHDVMEDIVATDDKTVTITQKFPWAWIFTSSNSGSPISSSILPEEILDDTGFLQRDAIGSGHWILDRHENGANIRFTKFPNFRTFQNGRDITGQPFLNGVQFRFITDDNAALAAFRDKQIDTFGFDGRKQMEDTVAQFGDEIVVGEDLARDYYTFMLHYEPPFDDERVRKAFNLLMDREEILLLMRDGDALKAGPIPPVHKRYALPEDDPDLREYFRHDVAEARQLLEQANFDFDREYELKHSNRDGDSKLAQILQAQLREGGVKIRLTQEDLVRWFSQTLNQHQFLMTCFLHLAYEDPDQPLRFYIGGDEATGRPNNFMDYADPEVDAAVIAAAQELDEEARVQKVYDAQKVIMRKYAPMLNVMSNINFGARFAYVKGSITGRGSYGLFNRTTWLDDEGRRQEA